MRRGFSRRQRAMGDAARDGSKPHVTRSVSFTTRSRVVVVGSRTNPVGCACAPFVRDGTVARRPSRHADACTSAVGGPIPCDRTIWYRSIPLATSNQRLRFAEPDRMIHDAPGNSGRAWPQSAAAAAGDGFQAFQGLVTCLPACLPPGALKLNQSRLLTELATCSYYYALVCCWSRRHRFLF